MIVIKIGGGNTINWENITDDIRGLIAHGEKIVIVHGASELRDKVADKMRHPTKTVTSPSGITSVYTDRKALEIFLMSYAGLANKTIVAALQKEGINAIGLSGVDGRLWEAKAKPNLMVKEGDKTKLIRDNLTGRVEKINSGLLRLLTDNSYVPVISAPAISYESQIVNTDNDTAAAVMAGALAAQKMIYLFEAPGLMKDLNKLDSRIQKISYPEIDDYMEYAKGRMKKKLLGAKKALELGVKNIYFGDGRIKKPISSAIEGNGTIISSN